MDSNLTSSMIPLDIIDTGDNVNLAAALKAQKDNPLPSAKEQLKILSRAKLPATARAEGDFLADLAIGGWDNFKPGKLEIFQINIGKLCNMTCKHCHVDSGPDKTAENMDRATVDACLAAIDLSGAHTVDLTGGAPELNPNFEYLVEECVKRGKHVIDRCNLTILMSKKYAHLPEWFAKNKVEVVCSLPHYRKMGTDAQRGSGTYKESIAALRRLNAAGYGKGDPDRVLTLVANPVGAFLSSNQATLEAEWRTALKQNHDISFDRLFTITNMPISRYLEWLLEKGQLETYLEKLVNAFNPFTIEGVMCRNTISVSWDGKLFDCDFNQMLEMQVSSSDSANPNDTGMTVHNFNLEVLKQRQILTARHCYGCTAGAGSSCGGAISA